MFNTNNFMMKTKFLITAFYIISLSSLLSCSHKLVGTWNVDKYETVSLDQQGISLSNIGTITFKGNQTGEKNIKYKVLGIHRNDNLGFDWAANENYVSIKNGGAEFSKTWIILESKRNIQRWKSTDGNNQVQILHLSK